MQAATATQDGTYVLAGGTSGSVYVWEAATGRLLRSWPAHFKVLMQRLPAGLAHCSAEAALQKLGVAICCPTGNHTIAAWHVTMPDPDQLFLLQAVTCLACSDGGRVLLSAAQDTLVHAFVLMDVLDISTNPAGSATPLHTW